MLFRSCPSGPLNSPNTSTSSNGFRYSLLLFTGISTVLHCSIVHRSVCCITILHFSKAARRILILSDASMTLVYFILLLYRVSDRSAILKFSLYFSTLLSDNYYASFPISYPSPIPFKIVLTKDCAKKNNMI